MVHRGTVYRATVTNPGEPSYHGFPELLGRLPPLRALRERLLSLAQAESADSLERVPRWLREGP